MGSKVYYGEYTLSYWLNLIVSKNIELPEYQRSFVWSKDDVVRFIKSLKDGHFVQPITLARFCEKDGTTKNYILDGQQRLTSILLAKIGRMPNVNKFKEVQQLVSDDDSLEKNDYKNDATMEWTFSDILSKYKTTSIETIYKGVTNDEMYCPLELEMDNIDDFLENTCLGFSYIILDNASEDDSQKYFATLFRNMNYWGKRLSPLESRRSLYYQNSIYTEYFEGKTTEGKSVLCDLKISENMQLCQIDFVRYLAILSQYYVQRSSDKIMQGYSSYKLRENFYADYVAYIIGVEQDGNIDKFKDFVFDDTFPNACWRERFETIYNLINNNKDKMNLEKTAFFSCIDCDYWLFGMIYYILFEGKKITFDDNLISQLSEAIAQKKGDEYYSKSPNLLNNIRERIDESIKIFEKYAMD